MRLLVTYIAATARNKYQLRIYESEARTAYAAEYQNELTRERVAVSAMQLPKAPEGREARVDIMYGLMKACLNAIEGKDGKVQAIVQTTHIEPLSNTVNS